MPWRLIGFILIFAVFVVFIGFNLENKSDISFVFTKIEQAPVYLIAFSSFALGMILAVPFVISLRLKKKLPKGKKKGESGETDEILNGTPNVVPPRGGGSYGID